MKKIDYSNSGINTLRSASIFLLVCGIVSALLFIPLWISENPRTNEFIFHWNMIAASVACFSSGLFFFGVGLTLSTIAECSLGKYTIRKNKTSEDKK